MAKYTWKPDSWKYYGDYPDSLEETLAAALENTDLGDKFQVGKLTGVMLNQEIETIKWIEGRSVCVLLLEVAEVVTYLHRISPELKDYAEKVEITGDNRDS